jgi:hypothetical protein
MHDGEAAGERGASNIALFGCIIIIIRVHSRISIKMTGKAGRRDRSGI